MSLQQVNIITFAIKIVLFLTWGKPLTTNFEKMKLLGSILLLLLTSIVYSQTPGNIGTTNLTAWFRADNLSGNVTNWTTTYPTGGSAITLTDASAPYSVATNTPAQSIFNYNTVVDFAGNAAGTPKYLSNTSTLNLLTNNSAAGTGTFFVVYARPIAGAEDCVVAYKRASFSDGVQMRGWGRIAIGNGNSTSGARNFTVSPVRQPKIISYKGNKSGATSMTAFNNDLLFTTPVSSAAVCNTGLSFGAKSDATWIEFFEGYIAEVIFFNNDLTNAQINFVDSYLAIKYGVTLDITGGGVQGDYRDPNGTVIWDASVNSNYHNDVIGIGREDSESLLQKQSHTFDDITRVYLSTLQATNVANTGTFTANNSYIVMGHNTGNMCASLASNAEIPGSCGLYSRLEREWKVTKTNFAQNCSMDFTLNACAQPGSVNVSHLRLLVDDDGDFSNGGTTCYFNGDGSGINITYSNPTITVSGISAAHLPNNATRYITIASIQSITPLPVDLISFEATKITNRHVDLTWETASEKNVDYFQIERSSNGTDWSLVGQELATGSENEEENYLLSDFQPIHPMTYYRLMEIDESGNQEMKGIRMVKFDEEGTEGILLYPNPTNNSMKLSSTNSINQQDMQLISSVGQECLLRFESTGETSGILYLEHLPAGIYLLQVDGKVHKIIKK